MFKIEANFSGLFTVHQNTFYIIQDMTLIDDPLKYLHIIWCLTKNIIFGSI